MDNALKRIVHEEYIGTHVDYDSIDFDAFDIMQDTTAEDYARDILNDQYPDCHYLDYKGFAHDLIWGGGVYELSNGCLIANAGEV